MPIDLRAELNLLPATPRTRRVRSILLVPLYPAVSPMSNFSTRREVPDAARQIGAADADDK